MLPIHDRFFNIYLQIIGNIRKIEYFLYEVGEILLPLICGIFGKTFSVKLTVKNAVKYYSLCKQTKFENSWVGSHKWFSSDEISLPHSNN